MTPADSTPALGAFAEIERAFFTDQMGEGAAADWEDRCFFPVRAALQQAAEAERLLGEARADLRHIRRLCKMGHGDDLIAETADRSLAAVPPGAGATQEPTT